MSYNCIFNPANAKIVDIIPSDSDGSAWFAEHGTKYGEGLIVLPRDEAVKRHEDHFRTEPVEITEEQWRYALECLPPVGWTSKDGGETFKMSERMSGAITGIYVRIGKRFFQFYDDIRLPHQKCLEKVVMSKDISFAAV